MTDSDMSVLQHATCNIPLVSIIVALYNAERYIAPTLRSALAQTHRNIEVIVVDDGSTDGSASIVEGIAATDPRVKLIRQKNAGAAAARNTALDAARGEFIAPLDADDIFDPRKIELQVALLQTAAPEVGLVYCWTQRIDEDGYIIPYYIMRGTLKGRCFASLIDTDPVGHGSGILIRRDVIRKVGGFDVAVCPAGSAGCEDQKLLLDVGRHYALDYVPEVLVGYRKSRTNATRSIANMLKLHMVLLDITRKAHPEIPARIFRRSYTKVVFWLITDSEAPGSLKANLALFLKTLASDPGFCATPWFTHWIASRAKFESKRIFQSLSDKPDLASAGHVLEGDLYMPQFYDGAASGSPAPSKVASASTL